MESAAKKRKSGRLLLLLPFLLYVAGLFFVGIYVFGTVAEENAYISLLVADSAPQETEDMDTGFVPGERPSRLVQIPSVAYGKQFARLNVTWEGDGWDIINIPVYLGSDKKTLKKGAGMSFASYFPGERGCTIISAHVTRHFAELEETPVGATVLLETSYGPYRYEVTEKYEGVDGADRWYMDASVDYDLILYSCYPRDNNGERRTQRCVLCCKLVDGVEVEQ
ncbi:MAG: sortase [Clostridia bacterium]|nr:sortase [Clostridia bacterium]